MIKKIIFFITAVIFLSPMVHAAVLTVKPPDISGHVVISLDTQGQSVNVVQAHIIFDPTILSIASINDGGSVINFWITSPSFSNNDGTIDLAGIIPGGITVKDGPIATLLVTPRISSGFGSFIIASTTILLNDGKGTRAIVSSVDAPFVLQGIPLETSSASLDIQAPDSFMPQIATNPNIFNGQYFLVFAATDQRLGVSRYEVLEVPAGTKSGDLLGWQDATSPYLLKDQTLSSDIYVRAVDSAGNFRVVKISSAEAHKSSKNTGQSRILFFVFGIIIVFLILIIIFIWRKKRNF